MKRDSLKIILLAIVGAVLAGAVLWAQRKGQPVVSVPSELSEAARITEKESRPTPVQTETQTTERPPFHWSQVESRDYQQYIANLRSIGCPEQTIRDIILADVNKLFEPREAPFKAELAGFQTQPWNDPTTEPGNSKEQFALRKQLREVEKEKQAVIKDLLGIDIPLAPIRGWHPRTYDRYEASLNTVSPEKRELVRQIQENYWEISDQLNDKYGLRRTPEFLEEYQRINADRKARLAQVLTPREFDDYEMRTTGIASRLSAHLSSLNVSADDFREIFRLKNALDAPYGGSVRVDMTEAGISPEYLQSQQAVEQKIAQILGSERYAAYQLAQDAGFRRFADLGERFGVPQEKVAQAYQLERDATFSPRVVRTARELATPAPMAAADSRERLERNQLAMKELLGEPAYNALRHGQNFRMIEDLFVP